MPIPKMPFGRTGHESTRTLFGAAALSTVSQADADRTLDVLLEYGVNHIDTAASYGESEVRIGQWMPQYRNHFFLATKTEERTYQAAKDEFEKSLERLQVDKVDLIQLHYLVGEDEWQVAMGEGGVLEYLIEVRDQGLVDYIGVTGHDVEIVHRHQASLDHFAFDSVLLPYNYPMMQNPEYAEGFNKILSLCAESNVAVQTIKSITRRPYQGDNRTHATWYEPLTEQADIDKAVHWVLGNEQVFLNTAGDIDLLPKVLDAASRYEARPSDESLQALVDKQAMKPLFE